ncbi:MAG: thioredoxin domain-containing protein [Acidobacteriota bacterium]
MKFITAIFCLLIFTFTSFPQKADEVLATANSQKFTAKDLSPEAGEVFSNLPKTIGEFRKSLLEQQIAEILFETEAATRKLTVEKLIETEVLNKIAAPTEKEIQVVYDANRDSIGNKIIDEVRPQIVAFLRREPEQKALAEYLSNLKVKYKAALGKDLGAPNLKPSDTLATINGKAISVENFEAKNKLRLYEFQADIYDQIQQLLEQKVYESLIAAEAKSQNIEAGDLIAREITDKLHDYSEEERRQLQTAFEKQLFQKYNAKFLLKSPAPVVQNISTENQPSQGKQTAPVTVVMFTDFQCPACSAVHPVLKKVLAEYGDKIRFVVRDFPLVNVHENAFRAALAANAANAQGKFFEYTELLYKNQNALDKGSLEKYAADLGLNQKQFDLDLTSEKYAADVKKDMSDGKTYGLTGTPTIFVNGARVRELSAEDFRKAIDRALKQ